MRFSELLEKSKAPVEAAEGESEVHGIQMDSRLVRGGELFACVPSANSNSHRYIEDALENGASCVLAHSEAGFIAARSKGLPAAWSPPRPKSFNECVWRLAKEILGNPSGSLRTVGVTGTNGKTTTALLIRDMLVALGEQPAYIGTLGFFDSTSERLLDNTTPFAVELMNLIADARSAGATTLSMEVSSHALAERRADGVEFDSAIFTNLTQDHLDFHGSMAEYEAAKLRLFEDLPSNSSKQMRMAFNVDDQVGAKWHSRFPNSMSFGTVDAHLHVEALEMNVGSALLEVRFDEAIDRVRVPLGGSFNVVNCAAALSGVLCLGFEFHRAIEALSHVKPVRGRFEAIPSSTGIGVLVDYAHTPDALTKLLDTVRSLSPSRVITVFGCGGDRDASKRPKMAAVVSARSDLSILTSDNPRTEDPEQILAQVAAGLAPGSESEIVVDRNQAIRRAIEVAQPGDIVVIAGKGHEDYQIIGRTKVHMDDREMALAALTELH